MPTILVIDHDRAPGTIIREFTNIDPTVAVSRCASTRWRQGDPAVRDSALEVGATAAQQRPFDVFEMQGTLFRASTHRQRLLAEAKDRTSEAYFLRRVS